MTEIIKEHLPYETLSIDDEIELRALSVEEASPVYRLVDENRKYLSEYLPFPGNTHSPEDSLAFIKSVINERKNGDGYGFAIFVSGQIVGHASLMHLEVGGTPEVGYWIAKSYSGKGITTKVASTLTNFGLNELKLNKILIRANPKNIASNKIAEKIGYKFEGIHEENNEQNNHWIIEADVK